MKKAAQIALAVVIGLVLMAPAGFAADSKYSGFLGDYYKNLGPGPKDGAKERWLKPGVNFGQYKKFMVDGIVFFFADDSEYKGIDPQEMKELADMFNKEIVAALKGKYPMVVEPGPDVARIRFAITGFKQSRPVLSAITSITPPGLAINVAKKGITGSWTGSGATSGELMALDSMTNDVIAVAVDEKTAGFTDRFTKWGSAEEAFKFWAGTLVKFMDNVTHKRK
jgi:hypothetical protein